MDAYSAWTEQPYRYRGLAVPFKRNTHLVVNMSRSDYLSALSYFIFLRVPALTWHRLGRLQIVLLRSELLYLKEGLLMQIEWLHLGFLFRSNLLGRTFSFCRYADLLDEEWGDFGVQFWRVITGCIVNNPESQTKNGVNTGFLKIRIFTLVSGNKSDNKSLSTYWFLKQVMA